MYGAVTENENTASAQIEPVVVSEQPVQTPRPEATPTKTETPQVMISSYLLDNSMRMERNRVYNIEKALAMLDGYVIKPGEKMSLNEVLGERSGANSWRGVPGIEDGRYNGQYGVGVPAVSSALYNAAIRAELTIVEVKHYTIISGYIPPAFDATINDDGTDLVIANPYDNEIVIKARMEDKNIIIEIYGPPLGYTVDFFSKKTAETEEPPYIYIYNATTMPDGTPISKGESMTYYKSRKGATYEVYKVIYESGDNEADKTNLYEVYTYPAIQGYIYVNLPAPNDWRQKFPGKFTTGALEQTENSYKNANISVTIEKVQRDGATYFIADIYVAELKYFRTAFPVNTDKMGGREATDKAAREVKAILAINGAQCVDTAGTVVHNGETYREQKSSADVLVMNYDGTMQAYSPDEFDVEKIKIESTYQVWTFGPMLLKDGQPMTEFNLPQPIADRNPRTAVGYYEPGHYCFVVVDGRQPGYSDGYTLTQLSQLFADLGCTGAYNLDGGQSSEMAFMGEIVNHPYNGGRSTTDILYVGE
jgi:exopolysaccharide biosynthesis protein